MIDIQICIQNLNQKRGKEKETENPFFIVINIVNRTKNRVVEDPKLVH